MHIMCKDIQNFIIVKIELCILVSVMIVRPMASMILRGVRLSKLAITPASVTLEKLSSAAIIS